MNRIAVDAPLASELPLPNRVVSRGGRSKRVLLWFYSIVLATSAFATSASAQVSVTDQEVSYRVVWNMGYGPLVSGGTLSGTSPDTANDQFDERYDDYYQPTDTNFSVAATGQVLGFSNAEENSGVTTITGQLASSTTIVGLDGPVGGSVLTDLNNTYVRFLFSLAAPTDYSLDITTDTGSQVQLNPIGGFALVSAIGGQSDNYTGTLAPGDYQIQGRIGHSSTIGNSRSDTFTFVLNLVPEGVVFPPPLPVPMAGPLVRLVLLALLGGVSLVLMQRRTA